MARGSIFKRCRICRREGKTGFQECGHREAEYVIAYRDGLKQTRETIGPNKKDAERRLAEVMSQINNGTYQKPAKIVFKDFAVKWLEEYAKISVKPSTYSTYKISINTHLIPSIGNLLVLQITPERIQQFVAETLKKRSPKTVNNLITQLKTMLKHAKRWGYVRENLALDIGHVRVEYKEMDYLNPDEIQKFLKQAREPFKTLLLTAIMTGMRRGELLAFQWGDIDWNSNAIFVRRSIYFRSKKGLEIGSEEPRWQFISPKSKRSIRAIVMSPVLKQALELHRITCPVGQLDLVFPNTEGNPKDPAKLIQREFLPTLSFAGLRRIRFHDLRHSYTSLLIAQGENIKFIQSQLGHASIQTTLDRYGHIFPSNQHGVGSRLDQQVFGVSDNAGITEYAQTPSKTIYQDKKEVVVTHSKI